jgi:uncharacterized protein YgfB (UPF0149 family)
MNDALLSTDEIADRIVAIVLKTPDVDDARGKVAQIIDGWLSVSLIEECNNCDAHGLNDENQDIEEEEKSELIDDIVNLYDDRGDDDDEDEGLDECVDYGYPK